MRNAMFTMFEVLKRRTVANRDRVALLRFWTNLFYTDSRFAGARKQKGPGVRSCWFCSAYYSAHDDMCLRTEDEFWWPNMRLDSMTHLHTCNELALFWQSQCENFDVDFSAGIMPTLLDVVLVRPSNKAMVVHIARLLAATFEIHNFCRNNDRPIRDIASGTKTFARIMKDIKTRQVKQKKIRKMDRQGIHSVFQPL